MKDVRLSYVFWGYAAEKIYQQKLISFVKLHHHDTLLQKLYCMSDSATSGIMFDVIYLANGNISICNNNCHYIFGI